MYNPTEHSRLLSNESNIDNVFSNDSNDVEDYKAILNKRNNYAKTNKDSRYFSFTSMIRKTAEDDLITLETKKLYFILTITISLWLLSFILIVYVVLNDKQIVNIDVILFIPMWLGTAIGIIKVVTMTRSICSNPTLVPRERNARLFMMAIDNESEDTKFIDYDSLPLMRRLFCSSFLLLISFFLIIITQVLYSLWFVYRMIDIWHALVPIIILFCLFIAYSSIVKAASLQTCLLLSLVFIQFVSCIQL